MRQTMIDIAMTLAFLPTVVIMCIVLGNAKRNTNPFKKIFTVFMISVTMCIPASLMEMIGQMIESVAFFIYGVDLHNMSNFQSLIYYFIQYMLIVGVSEELCKFVVFKWIINDDRCFDNTYDGVIYGAAAALGFATLENIMYVFGAQGIPIVTALIRAGLSVPMHAATGILMGHYFGIAKYRKYNNIKSKSKPEITALIISIILHGSYDFIVTIPNIYESSSYIRWVFIISTLLYVTIIYFMIAAIIKTAKKHSIQIYNRYYYENLVGAYQDKLGKTTTDISKLNIMVMQPYLYNQLYHNNKEDYTPYHPINMQVINNPVYDSLNDRSQPSNIMESMIQVNKHTEINIDDTTINSVNDIPDNTTTVDSHTFMSVKNCKMCGDNIKTRYNFCPFCGHKVD